MSKKHYVMIARALRSAYDLPEAFHRLTVRAIVLVLADEFAHDNVKFDRARFMKAATGDKEAA